MDRIGGGNPYPTPRRLLLLREGSQQSIARPPGSPLSGPPTVPGARVPDPGYPGSGLEGDGALEETIADAIGSEAVAKGGQSTSG